MSSTVVPWPGSRGISTSYPASAIAVARCRTDDGFPVNPCRTTTPVDEPATWDIGSAPTSTSGVFSVSLIPPVCPTDTPWSARPTLFYVNGQNSRWGAGIAAIAPLVVVAPFWFALTWLAGRLLAALAPLPWWSVPLAWLVSGLTLFWRPVQVAALAPVVGGRAPTTDEWARLAPIWTAVSSRANLHDDRFVLRVIDSNDLNAFACGGHLVLVTTFALDHLDDEQLAGVLAHEVGHHLGLHTVALTATHWLSLPITQVSRTAFALQNVATAATNAFVAHSSALTALGRVSAGIARGIAWALLSVVYAADATANLVAHRSEFDADRRAIQMGFGAPLASALREVVALGHGGRAVGWRARLHASHPAARTRIARIEAVLRHPSNLQTG